MPALQTAVLNIRTHAQRSPAAKKYRSVTISQIFVCDTKKNRDLCYAHCMADANTELNQLISEPKRARDDAVEVQQHSITEMIAADKHLRATSRSSPLAGIFRFKMRSGRPGGRL